MGSIRIVCRKDIGNADDQKDYATYKKKSHTGNELIIEAERFLLDVESFFDKVKESLEKYFDKIEIKK